MRIDLRKMMAIVALCGLSFAVFRSYFSDDVLGLLIWPSMLGFGAERLCRGEGVFGSAAAGGLGFTGFCSQPAAYLLIGPAGVIWGFYLGVWMYILVETLIYYLY